MFLEFRSYLHVVDEVDVVVLGQHLSDPLADGLIKIFIFTSISHKNINSFF